MRAISRSYFTLDILKKFDRTHLIVLAAGLAAAGGVLVVQSIKYAISLPDLLANPQNDWWTNLSPMLQSITIWALVLGVVYAIQFTNVPATSNGRIFLNFLIRGFAFGLLLPYALLLAGGIWIYIPLGLLSLFFEEILPFASPQFACLAAAYLVLIWIAVGMPRLLIGTFIEEKWYFKFIVVLLFLLLSLDVLQAFGGAVEIILNNSIWLMNNTAILLAVFGSLFVTIAAVLLSLRKQSALTIVYAIAGIYTASIVTGNVSDSLFQWGEIPSAIVAFLCPLAYLQVAKWIIGSDGTAVTGLAAAFAGMLAGLLIDQILHLRIIGQGWFSLMCGVAITLGLGLSLGFIFGPGIAKLLARGAQFKPVVARYIEFGMIAGIMTGMLLGGLLAR